MPEPAAAARRTPRTERCVPVNVPVSVPMNIVVFGATGAPVARCWSPPPLPGTP
jgi:hypothetical protein